MKLPYRLGDSFALPLGNGQVARSCIVQCEHRVVVIRVWIGDESWLDLRVSDDALVLHRWRRDGSVDLTALEEPRPKNVYWMAAARAERLTAAAIGVPHPRERKIAVRELRDDNVADALRELDDDSILALTEAISPQTIEHVTVALHNHPGVTVRLNGAAAAQLRAFAAAPFARLILAGDANEIPALPSLRHLQLLHAHDLRRIAAVAPNLESLRVAARGSVVDVRDMQELARLRALDLSLVAIADTERFEGLPQISQLRLNRVTGMSTTDALAALSLRTLAVEHLHELQTTSALARIPSIEQLELRGLWQLDIADVEWTLMMKNLKRAEIDIGGRRKNLELYRRAQWAYPWRFPGTPTS